MTQLLFPYFLETKLANPEKMSTFKTLVPVNRKIYKISRLRNCDKSKLAHANKL